MDMRCSSRSIGPSKTGVRDRVGHRRRPLPNGLDRRHRAPAARGPVVAAARRRAVPWRAHDQGPLGHPALRRPPPRQLPGALRHWVAFQDDARRLLLRRRPPRPDRRRSTRRTSRAAPSTLRSTCWPSGLDPERCTLFVQSHVPEHPRAGLAARVHGHHGRAAPDDPVQGQGPEGQESARVGLFTYPVLMAADILLYDADRVPVGDDQRQHLELARELAHRFNNRYGDDLHRARGGHPRAGAPGSWTSSTPSARCPSRSTRRSAPSACSTSAEEIERKVKQAVTDTDGEVRYDPAAKPGLANLLELLAAATGRDPRGGGRRLRALRRPQERRGGRPDASCSGRCARRRAELEQDLPYVHAVLDRRGGPGPRGGRRHLRDGRPRPSACSPSG